MKMRILVVALALVGAVSLAVSASIPKPGVPDVKPTPAPVMSPDYHECPYCHYILPGKTKPDGTFEYASHRMVVMPVSETMVFATCERNYFLYLGPVMLDLQRTGMGETVETKGDDNKPPTDAPHKRTSI